MPTEVHESALVDRAVKGDGDAFGELVGMYEKRIYSFALGMLSDPDDAFDVSQDTFLKAFRSLHTFKRESSFYTWLYSICRNCCYDFLKTRQAHLRHNLSLFEYEDDDDGRAMEIPDRDSSPESIFEKKRIREAIFSAIQSLPDHHREIIILRDIEELSYEEIALSMNINEGTVKSRLSRARTKLQQLLKDKI